MKVVFGIIFFLIVIAAIADGGDSSSGGETTTSWHTADGGSCSRSTDESGSVRTATVCVDPDGSVTDVTTGP